MINIVNPVNGLLGMTRETMKQVDNVFKSCLADNVAKVDTQGITTGTNLVSYDLQPGAKLLYPVLTPFRNEIPRVKGDGGKATEWKAITGVNVGRVSIGVSEGNRNAVMTTSEQDYLAKYASLGLENSVTFEGDESAEGFDDVKALGSRNLLQAMMIGEEAVILGGNASLALGTTPTPSTGTAATGGSLPQSTTYSVIAVALTFEGWSNATVAGGIPSKITRTNADGTTDSFGGGSAIQSAAASQATAAGTATNVVTASVAPVKGAFGYAWFFGAAGSEKLAAITTINSVKFTDVAAGTQTAASLDAADQSKNGLVFDGYLTQICKTGSNAYYRALPTGTAGTGSTLTANGAGGITEIDTALQSFWDNYRVSPDEIVVSGQELNNITAKVIAGGGTPLFRFNLDGAGNENNVTVTAGAIVGSYLNKFAMGGGVLIPVRLHPNMPPGTILFRKKTIPYPLSNVTNICEIRYLRDYYQIAWPLRTRKYEFGVYAREVMPIYFTPAFGIITNIANG